MKQTLTPAVDGLHRMVVVPMINLIDWAIIVNGDVTETGKCVNFEEISTVQLAREVMPERVIVDDSHRTQEALEAAHHYGWATHSGIAESVAVQLHLNTIIEKGSDLIASERRRQIVVERYLPAHDDMHTDGSLARAAACYAATAAIQVQKNASNLPSCFIHKDWPWERQDWNPANDPVKNLVKAGALIAAEIDRLDRLQQAAPQAA